MDSKDPDSRKINLSITDKEESKPINNQTCFFCLESKNIYLCETCKISYHMRCLIHNSKIIPNKINCSECTHTAINNDTKLSDSPSYQESKTISNPIKLNSFELKQRSSRKDLLGYSSIKKSKKEKETGITSISNSFSYKEGLDKEFDNNNINRERVNYYILI